ncbi:MAG: type phosphodiesterase/nucleotide pyrophosphatase [Pedosphaera sp.]|nr:type phosphodiesterase/nucleotide pyrophosphatase [Pedosphaera sp.]
MKRTAVLNVVGLTESLLGAATPRINEFLAKGAKATITPAFPAVTCTAQSTYLTGAAPTQHGIVANGWYNRELAEVQFWKQSNHLVHGRKIWEELRELEPGFTCAKLFWWYNMYSTADYSITPRPMYPADGRKFFDIYAWPYSIRTDIKIDLGEFPFATFWGPAAGLKSPQGGPDAASRWIAASAKWIETKHAPSLSLVYLPHLDYNLQRLGPKHPDIAQDLRQIDSIVGDLIEFFQKRSVQVLLLSEYGITPVDTPIHLNRMLRKDGYLTVKQELGLEILDCGASKAFAVADHQIAHVYLNDPAVEKLVRLRLEQEPGVEKVLNRAEQAALGIDHPRAGDLIAVAKENAWFTYYYWLDDQLAPDFARCVDIHRKPGYDPVELFLDPKIPAVKLKILWRLLKKKLGFRMLMDVIPLDATLVKGSHGRRPASTADYPVFITERPELLPNAQIEPTDVYDLIKRHVLH